MADRCDPGWLRRRMARILGFYYPSCVDDRHGGFLAQLHPETGSLYDDTAKHVVATARFTVNFARACRHLPGANLDLTADAPGGLAEEFRTQIARGVAFLQDVFRDQDRGGYHWLVRGRNPVDSRRVCYGHAFVLLAFARALDAGVEDARGGLEDVATVLDARFYEPDQGLYRSEFDADWTKPEPYRGQNANMHACEALLAAHRATGDDEHLARARRVARRLCVDLAAETDGRLWEHYNDDWAHDFTYNRDAPADQFRPWGYQPGHHAEWAKLLCLLDRRLDPAPDWVIPRAEELFGYATGAGWDADQGGFYYTLSRNDEPMVRAKYGWPVAEAIGAAAALYERTGETDYLDWYDRLWTYAEETLVAPGGNWYERVTESGTPVVDPTGPAVEPGYHPIGACTAGLRSFGLRSPPDSSA